MQMKNNPVQQEILLVTNSAHTTKEWSEKSTGHDAPQRTPAEQLEAACWNGALEELIPEVLERTANGRKLFLWQVIRGTACLQIELSEFPLVVEKAFSIVPDLFLSASSHN